jgi:multicomponent K+:H+ antiporter subunit F
MIAAALTFAFGCFSLALIMNLWRLLRGPEIPDRVLALDTMVVNMIALLVLYGIRENSGINFEAALLFALTGFVSSVAYARFMLRGNIIE